MLNMLSANPRCESCDYAEEHGPARCFHCGTPLTPSDSSIQLAVKTYFQIRSLSLTNLQFCHEILDGKLYTAATDNDHARVLFFIGPDWVGLEYGCVWPSARSDIVNLLAERISGWHSELLRWKALPFDQKIPVEHVQSRYGYMQFLAAFDAKTAKLTLRSFTLGDWTGLFARPFSKIPPLDLQPPQLPSLGNSKRRNYHCQMQPKSPEASSANAKTFALICLLVTLWGCSKQSEPAKSVPVIAPTSSREVGVKVTDQALVFIYEIRLKPALSDDPQTYICWFDGDDENGGNLLMSTTSRVEADAWIYAREPEIVFLETDRLTFAVQPPRQPVQVFKFSKPADTSSGNWSEWKKPDYVEDTTSAQFILEAGQRHNISTNVPQGCFEFRFKFVDFGKYTPDAQASPVILEDDSPLDEHTAVTNRSTPSP